MTLEISQDFIKKKTNIDEIKRKLFIYIFNQIYLLRAWI